MEEVLLNVESEGRENTLPKLEEGNKVCLPKADEEAEEEQRGAEARVEDSFRKLEADEEIDCALSEIAEGRVGDDEEIEDGEAEMTVANEGS